MSNLAIKVEDISKLYRLGQVGTGTLQQDIKRWWWKISGKGDPFAKVGEVNDRASKGVSDYVWALKDINFEVEQGKVLGIIGRNGAGKSTLLKILSKTTSPTSGSIKINGRIASLLEVGTGFHPELTGRENIYLNGAILGMTKREIRSKFDEIVDFSGVERYIDTPVKRYSSGMYVRLAFAVAAHLEPEILIVDEVLAVGDAEFQKKCLGKMKDVSVNDGRTVLFVSHNMSAISNLCDKAILMDKGTISDQGDIKRIIEEYSIRNSVVNTGRKRGNLNVDIQEIKILNNQNSEVSELFMYEDINIAIKVHFNKSYNRNLDLGINIRNSHDEIFSHITNLDVGFKISGEIGETKNYNITLKDINITPGHYLVDLGIVDKNDAICIFESCSSFNLLKGKNILRPGNLPDHVKTFLKSEWREN